MPSLSSYLKAGQIAVNEAEKILIKHFDPTRLAKVQLKAHKEFVTKADLASNTSIIKTLKRLTPDIPVLSEESKAPKQTSDLVWVLDPLDGTTNFTIGLPLWGISLALVKNGKPIIGIISIPLLKERYHAIQGSGAFRNGKKIKALAQKPNLDLAVGLLCHGYAESEKHAHLSAIPELVEKTHSTRRLGSAVIELTWVATGRAAYLVIHGAKPWDLAAGTLIASESGLKLLRPDGEPWHLNDPDCVAVHPKIAREVMRLLNPSPTLI